MRKVITLELHPRPEYVRVMLEYLRRCEGIGEYLILPHVAPDSEEVMALALGIDFAEVHITLDPKRLLRRQRTYLAWERGFEQADFIIHIERDAVPARDCLRYLEHCGQAYFADPAIFSITAYNGSPEEASTRGCELGRRRAFTGWLLGTWKNRWEWSKRHWGGGPGPPASNLEAQLAKREFEEIYPLLSRCQAISAVQGAHLPPSRSQSGILPVPDWSDNYTFQRKHFSESTPLVTAVMITGLHKARYALARVAIACFKRQTYPNKRLLIINHGEESLFCGDPRIDELRLTKVEWQTVGDLRNFGLKNATGDFIINWDDDDWHHPKRIEIQMTAQEGDSAVLLKNRIHYSFLNGCARYANSHRGAEATILHPREVPFRYPSLWRGSDTVFARQFARRVAVENDPALYFRFHHGLNLWDARHIMGHLAERGSHDELLISPRHQRVLTRVLSLYRGYRPVRTELA